DAEMLTVDLADTLTFSDGDGLEVVDGEGIPAGDDNLVCRALVVVGRRAHVRLEKRIPPGAGLGGGSADAAAVLRWSGCDDIVVDIDEEVRDLDRGPWSVILAVAAVIALAAVGVAIFVALRSHEQGGSVKLDEAVNAEITLPGPDRLTITATPGQTVPEGS